MASLFLLRGWIHNQSHSAGEHLPFRLFGRELFAPLTREAIEPGALSLIRQLPRRGDPAFRLQPMKRRIQRPRLDLEQVFGGPLNVFSDRVPMGGSGKQGSKDQEVERASQKLDMRWRFAPHCVDTLPYIM